MLTVGDLLFTAARVTGEPPMPRHSPMLTRFVRILAGAGLLFVCLFVSMYSDVAAQPTPPKLPPVQTKSETVAILESRWQATPAIKPSSPILLFDSYGQTLVLTGRLRIEAESFNARTGKPGFQLATPPDVKGSNFRQMRLEKGVVLFQQGSSVAKDLISWDTRSGNIARVPFQTVGRGLHWLNVSPNGRYMSVTTKKRAKTGEVEETPLRVFDQVTGKTVVSMDWLSGATAFTADSSRILTVDATDRFQWFRLPGGTPDGEWKFDRKPVERPIRIVGLSADGGAILYSGAPPNKPFGVHLLNGKTGEVLLSFSNQQYFQDVGFISPDGNSIVLVRRDPTGKESTVELLDSRGALLARLGLPPSTQPFLLPGLAVSWEARALAVYHFDTNKLEVFNLPGAPVSLVSRKPRDAAFKTRSPIPADAAIVKAEADIRQLLKDEFARKQPSERKALAQKLIKLAAETPDDPASRYVMLREAQDLAVGLVDPALALQVIEQLAKGYDIEGPAQQLGAL
ncbi:MAG TPA: hypothetical protein VLM40_16445, partial [Gemmata sp.]|nr:hypothetical protein [Gemmata sp.]